MMQFDDEMSDSVLLDFTTRHIANLPTMKRKEQAKVRDGNILPALDEARTRIVRVKEQLARDKQRIAMGKKPTKASEPRTFLDCDGVEDFYRLVGVKPGTVWKWMHLKRQSASHGYSDEEYTDEQNAWEAAVIKEQKEGRDAYAQRVRDAAAQQARDAETLKEIIAAGKKALAMKHHPDRGGSVEVMQDINRVADETTRWITGT